MATPRSLRSFLDATPPEILDTPFQALVFLTRAEHDALLSQITTLHRELADKQRALQESTVNPECDVECKEGGLLASIDAELQRTRVSFLEQENAGLLQEKQALAITIEETNAKARALQGEVFKLRAQLQLSQQNNQQLQQARELATAQPEEVEDQEMRRKKEKEILEARNKVLESENDRLKTQLDETKKELHELRNIMPETKELSAKYEILQSENDSIIKDRLSLQESLRRFTEHNSQLFETAGTLEIQVAASQKTNEGLKESLARREQENKAVISKNHDLADENAKLEKEGHKLQKEKIALEVSNEALLESKTAVEAEVRALQAKLNGTRDPDDEERYRQDLKSRNERLLEDKKKVDGKLVCLEGEIKSLRAELLQKQDRISHLRREGQSFSDEQTDLLDEIRQLKRLRDDLTDENDTWRRDCTVLRKDVLSLGERLRNAEQRLQRGIHPTTKSPQSRTAETFEETMASLPNPPNQLSKGPRTLSSNEPPRGPKAPLSAKRKALESPRLQKNSGSASARPATSDNNREKRQKVNQSSPLPPPPVTTIKRRSAIYLVEVSHLVSSSALHAALVKLGPEIEGLRRVFYGQPGPPEKWVVKFTSAPKEFVKHIFVISGVFATLGAAVGSTCAICRNEDHDTWQCSFLDAKGKDRPTAKQLEVGYRPLSLGVASSAIPPNPPTPADEPSPRSLHERVSFPMGRAPPRQGNRPQASSLQSTEETRLLNLSRTERRALFCRFSGTYVPKEDQLLTVICGGPVDLVKVDEVAQMGYVDFVYPKHAEEFLKHAISNINGKFKFYDRKPGFNAQFGTVEFQWSDMATKSLDLSVARGIVTEGWTRVITLQMVPKALTIDRICSHADCDTLKKLGFWVEEDAEYAGVSGMRDVRIEFRSIEEAQKAFVSLTRQGYPEHGLRFSKEETMRPVPSAQ